MNPDARLLRQAAKGYCVNCAVTEVFQGTEVLQSLIELQGGPEALRYEHIQQQFANVMRVGLADAFPDEIDWLEVIANWELAFPRKPRGLD